jgi:hypothetical protein
LSGSDRWKSAPDLDSYTAIANGFTLDGTKGTISSDGKTALAKTCYKFTVTDSTGATADASLSLSVAAVDEMTHRMTVWIAFYLLVFAILAAAMTVSLWSSHRSAPTAHASNCADGGKPLQGIDPEYVDVGSPTSVLLEGCFPDNPQVKVNGAARQASFSDKENIEIALSAADVAASGALVITVFDNAGKEIGSGAAWVVTPRFEWDVFGKVISISTETQILLLVLFVGAFGSSIYALKSLGDYRGEDKLYASWALYYVIQPLEGAGAAFLFYVTVRGGFLSAAGGDAKSVNQFGMCAIAALAGTFSDMAFMKLRETFQTLFKPKDDRGDKVSDLAISTKTLPDGTVGDPYASFTLQVTGGTAPLKWSVSPDLPDGLNLDAATGTIGGTPTAASPKAPYTFTVSDSATPPQSATAQLSLQINAQNNP